jgi:hypothetical protein
MGIGRTLHETLVAQVFNLCTRTGKMPVPPKTFQDSGAKAMVRSAHPTLQHLEVLAKS